METNNKPIRSAFRSEEQKQAYLKHLEEHQRRMETDPDYRAKWEKIEADFQRIALVNDCEMD